MKPSYVRISGIRSGFYKIDRICHLAGLTPRMLRYYEKIGLIPPPLRTDGGTRLYQDEHLRLLMEIVSAKRQGLTLRAIKNQLAPHVRAPKNLLLVDSFFSPDPAILKRTDVRVMPMTIRFGYYKYADYTTLDPQKFAGLENRKRILAEVDRPAEAEYRETLSRASRDAAVISLHPDQRLWNTYTAAKSAAGSLAPAPLKVIDTGLWGGINFYWDEILASPQKLKTILAQARQSVSEIFIVRSPERIFPAAQKNNPYNLLDFTPVFQHTAQSGLVPIAREKDFAAACRYVWQEVKSLPRIVAYSSPETLAAAHAQGIKAAKEIPLSSAFLATFGREVLAIFVKSR